LVEPVCKEQQVPGLMAKREQAGPSEERERKEQQVSGLLATREQVAQLEQPVERKHFVDTFSLRH
jgi:hypothetical protein